MAAIAPGAIQSSSSRHGAASRTTSSSTSPIHSRVPGSGWDLTLVDGDVASGRAGIDLVPEFVGRSIEQLLRLDRDVPVTSAVIAVADQSLARLGDDGLDRPRRQAPRLRNMDSKDFHGESLRGDTSSSPIRTPVASRRTLPNRRP